MGAFDSDDFKHALARERRRGLPPTPAPPNPNTLRFDELAGPLLREAAGVLRAAGVPTVQAEGNRRGWILPRDFQVGDWFLEEGGELFDLRSTYPDVGGYPLFGNARDDAARPSLGQWDLSYGLVKVMWRPSFGEAETRPLQDVLVQRVAGVIAEHGRESTPPIPEPAPEPAPPAARWPWWRR